MKYLQFVVLLFFSSIVFGQDTILPLWPQGKIPNHVITEEKEVRKQNEILRISNVQQPTIEVYLPSKRQAIREAVLIFPGGGYGVLAYDWEGTDIAKFLNGNGIAGIVVKYRLPSSKTQTNKFNVPLIDAQRAMRLVRSKAEEFYIDADKIGILGFSAGGHLAATLGTHFSEEIYEPIDFIDEQSARPDFMALGYPVISFGAYTHMGSRKNLIGERPTSEMVTYFSTEKQVKENTPPTFLFHASDDKVVSVTNSILFYEALKEKGISATMHIYPNGGHGFSLGLKDSYLRGWTDRMLEWMGSLKE